MIYIEKKIGKDRIKITWEEVIKKYLKFLHLIEYDSKPCRMKGKKKSCSRLWVVWDQGFVVVIVVIVIVVCSLDNIEKVT